MWSTVLLQRIFLFCLVASLMLNDDSQVQGQKTDVESAKSESTLPILVPKAWWTKASGSKPVAANNVPLNRSKSNNEATLPKKKTSRFFNRTKSNGGAEAEVRRMQKELEARKKAERDSQYKQRKQTQKDMKVIRNKYQSGTKIKHQFDNTGFRVPGYFDKNNENYMWD